MKDFKRFTGLFCAFTKGKVVHIINKTNSRSRKVIRVADFKKVSIVEKERNRRERGPMECSFGLEIEKKKSQENRET